MRYTNEIQPYYSLIGAIIKQAIADYITLVKYKRGKLEIKGKSNAWKKHKISNLIRDGNEAKVFIYNNLNYYIKNKVNKLINVI